MESWRPRPSLQVGFLVSWCPGVLVSWYPEILVSWFHDILVSWYHDILVSWYHDILVSPLLNPGVSIPVRRGVRGLQRSIHPRQ